MKEVLRNLKELDRPFSVLAPMEDVTDVVFREIVEKCGAPDLFFSEFTSVEGMFSPGADEVKMRLEKKESATPLFAQIWGIRPENYYRGAKEIVALGFDGIDLNMGCPVRKITKQGACSALIRNHKLAGEIIGAVKEGAGDLPVSVKTRVGFDVIDTENWIGFLLEQGLDMLTVHGRIASEMSSKPNNWDEVGKAVVLRDEIAPETLIVGNGDVESLKHGREISERLGLDGFMIGRGVFNNPWVFNESVNIDDVTIEQRLGLLKEHVELFERTWGERKNFAIMKKFFKMYVKGFDGAGELRNSLMECRDAVSVTDVLDSLK